MPSHENVLASGQSRGRTDVDVVQYVAKLAIRTARHIDQVDLPPLKDFVFTDEDRRRSRRHLRPKHALGAKRAEVDEFLGHVKRDAWVSVDKLAISLACRGKAQPIYGHT
jgi:hypothetical protein